MPDRLSFLLAWAKSPLLTAAQTPSGVALTSAMAAAVNPAQPGLVLDLGAGTGAVTAALVRRGVAPRRLVLVESNPSFCALLRRRWPEARVIEDDAYSAVAALTAEGEMAAAVVSGLPVVQRPAAARLRLVLNCLRLTRRAGPFVQFTYLPGSPVPLRGLRGRVTRTIWSNFPPARVWTYRGAAPMRDT